MKDFSILYQKEAIEFVTVAKEYLSIMEAAKNMNSEDFIDNSIKILPLLYLKGELLPGLHDYDEDYIEKFVDEPTWVFIQQASATKLAEDDEYVEVQDISVFNNTDYLNVALSEIFADIYQEMGDLIGAYRLAQEPTMLAALYTCKENFSSYWGIRVILLLKNLHQIKYKQKED